MRRWALFFITMLLWFPVHARGQAGDDVEVSVITMGPGPLVYERFGHIAIRMRNTQTGFDVLFDWGNFDFEEPNFVGKFIKGSLLYSIDGKQSDRWLAFYGTEQDRTITEQVLDLDPAQKDKLRSLIAKNLENPRYLYDYFLDNCSTRVRDAIDQATDGQLAPQWTALTPHSYRWHSRRLMDVGIENKALSALMDFTYSGRADHPLTQWQATFVPMELSKLLDTATISRADGSTMPLVKERRQLNSSALPGNSEPSESRSPLRFTLPIGLVLATLVFVCSRCFRVGYWVLTGLWSGFAAFGSILFFVLICFTRHWVVAWNENFLQFSPVSILIFMAVLVPRLRRTFVRLPWVIVGLSVIGLAITISHLTPQLTAPAVALALPLHLAVCAGWKRKPATVEGASRNVPIA
jgi:hypothetical protein